MNRDQAKTLLVALSDDNYDGKVAALSLVLDLLTEAAERERSRPGHQGWDRSDPAQWADPPERPGPPINPSYIELLNERTRLRTEKTRLQDECETLLQAARDVTTRIDRAGHAAAIAHLTEIVRGIDREDTDGPEDHN